MSWSAGPRRLVLDPGRIARLRGASSIILGLAIFLAAMATRSEPFHAGVAVFSLAAFVAYIALLFTRLR